MSITESNSSPYASGEDEQEEHFVNIATDESLPAVGAPAEIEERRVESSASGSENNNNSMVENTNNDDERKPSATRPAVTDASPLRGHHKSDCRFLCAICLDTVSDEPVVTRCGHIFCWPCLYQWLAPGMLLGEYYAAFGGGAVIGGTNNHGGSRGNLNHFITAGYNNSNDGPYNPARWNEQRRCCPVCKAFCSVDSVIPVYIHVYAGAADGGGEEENTTTMHPSQQQQSQQLEEQPTTNSNNNDGGEHNAHSADEELLSTPLSPQLLDPSTANMGLRQRRPPVAPTTTSSTTSSSSNNNARQQQQESTLLDSPEQTQRLYENIPTNVTVTPVIANLGGGGGREEEDGVPVQVPSRPLISPTPATSSSRHRQEYDNHNDMPRPPVLNSSAAAASTTASSFRLQYRPRHNADYRQTQMGGIMGLVSGIVHSIDNIGATTENQQQQQQRSLSSRRSEVPVLHRSDGGLGGIGRQNNQQGTALQHLNNAGGIGGN